MFKIISSFTVLMGLASLAFSSTQMEEERQPKKITFNLPQVSAQEDALNAQMRNVLLETSRHFSLKQRLDAVRLLSLMDMYEAKIVQMRRFEKRNNDDTVQATKLVKERKEIRGKIQSLVNTFHSDWATGDKSKVYQYPPFSMESQEKLTQAMGSLFYRCPQSGSLEIDHASFSHDFFPLRVYFLKPEDKKALLFTGSHIYRNPDNLQFEPSKLFTMRSVIARPCTWTYPKDTYLQWFMEGNNTFRVDEVTWTSAFRENLLTDEYVKKDWDRTLTEMAPSFVVKAENFMPQSFLVYYGVEDEDFENKIDLLIANAHGKVFYKGFCFHEDESWASVSHHLKLSLTPESFTTPEDLYGSVEEIADVAETESDPFEIVYL